MTHGNILKLKVFVKWGEKGMEFKTLGENEAEVQHRGVTVATVQLCR